jgi:phosphoglycerate dehydrogenase-like enzyme
MRIKRKVCFTAPVKSGIAEALLRSAGCELVMGKSQDDFRRYRYERKELIELIGDCPILYPSGRDTIGADILDSCPDLQAVVKSSIGIETVDVEAATELGILCCNSPTPENYLGVAEATIGLMVALFKRLKLNESVLRRGGWKELENRGTLMAGKTVGIIGLGRIGRNVAKRLAGWDLNLLGYDPYVDPATVRQLGIQCVALEELLRQSHLVTLHVVLTRQTRGMLGLSELKMMKPSAFIVNTSRGAVIKERDLAAALEQNIIAGAALDVFEEEPLPADSILGRVDPTRLILTPHNIGANPGSGEAGQKMAAQSILCLLDGTVPDTVVNRDAIDLWRARFWSEKGSEATDALPHA